MITPVFLKLCRDQFYLCILDEPFLLPNYSKSLWLCRDRWILSFSLSDSSPECGYLWFCRINLCSPTVVWTLVVARTCTEYMLGGSTKNRLQGDDMPWDESTLEDRKCCHLLIFFLANPVPIPSVGQVIWWEVVFHKNFMGHY
jgi:hypothetical protein